MNKKIIAILVAIMLLLVSAVVITSCNTSIFQLCSHLLETMVSLQENIFSCFPPTDPFPLDVTSGIFFFQGKEERYL